MTKIYDSKEQMIEDYKNLRNEVMADIVNNNINIQKESKNKKILVIIITSFIALLIIIGLILTTKRTFSNNDKWHQKNIKEEILECIEKGNIKLSNNTVIVQMEDLYLGKCDYSKFYFKNDTDYQCLGYITINMLDNNQYSIDTNHYCDD